MSDNKWGVKAEEARILKDLEQLIGKSISRSDVILPESTRVHVEGNHIIELGLYNCELSELPDSFGMLQSLKNLFIEKCKLISLPDSFGELKSLQSLSLRDNHLQNLPDTFGDLHSLNILLLEGNKLINLPESFGNLKSLQKLILGCNWLKTLPTTFSKLQSIQVLNLETNQLSFLPKSFGELRSLLKLYLGDNEKYQSSRTNELETLPDSFSNLSLLQELSLNKNKFRIFPEPICKLQSLNYLDLSHNQLNNLPDCFGNLISLEALSLHHNKLTSLPDSFWRLQNLKELILGNEGDPYETNKWKGKLARIIEENTDYEGFIRNISFVLDYLQELAGINIFISYAVSDYDTGFFPISELAINLAKRKEIYYAYHCKQDMALESNIDKFMYDTIPKCQVILFIATPQSLRPTSDCRYELARARSLGLKIIPILKQIEWVDPALKQLGLNRVYGYQFQGQSLDQLCDIIYQDICTYKREHNVFEHEEANLENILEYIETIFAKFLTPKILRTQIKSNLLDLQSLIKTADTEYISPRKFISQFIKIVSENNYCEICAKDDIKTLTDKYCTRCGRNLCEIHFEWNICVDCQKKYLEAHEDELSDHL